MPLIPNEDILVEFDNFFLDATKSLLAQNVPETGDIIEGDPSAKSKSKENKNESDSVSNNNETYELAEEPSNHRAYKCFCSCRNGIKW